jgi:DDE domain
MRADCNGTREIHKLQKRYLYRAADHQGQAVDMLLRAKRDRARAEALFRRALSRTGITPRTVVSDHHQPYIKAVASVAPLARHIRTGLHRARGETTKAIERSHVATRDRLRGMRGLKTVATGQRFPDCVAGLPALRRGPVKWRALVPSYRPTQASPHATTRAVIVAMSVLGAQLKRAAWESMLSGAPVRHVDSALSEKHQNTSQTLAVEESATAEEPLSQAGVTIAGSRSVRFP